MKEDTLLQKTNTKQQIDIRSLAQRLDVLISKEAENIPYKKGNIVYIKQYGIIKKDRHCFIIQYKGQKIATMFDKTSAWALVKHLLRDDQKLVNEVLEADRQLSKYYNDSLFYLNILANTKDETRSFVAETRLDISQAEIVRYIDVIGDLADC